MKVLFIDKWAELTELERMMRQPGTSNGRKLSLPGADGARGRGGMTRGEGLGEAGDSLEESERNCLTSHCQNNSDLWVGHVLSTPSTPTSFFFSSLIFCWCLRQKLSREQKTTVILPREAYREGWQMDLSWQITNTDT